jgi:predicted RNase H-like HicB family nuclease
VENSGYIVLTFKFRKGKNGWSGLCEELGTAVDGKTLQETEDLLKELVGLHLASLEEIGERERFFKEHHIELHHRRPTGTVSVHIPVNGDTLTSSHVHELTGISSN